MSLLKVCEARQREWNSRLRPKACEVKAMGVESRDLKGCEARQRRVD